MVVKKKKKNCRNVHQLKFIAKCTYKYACKMFFKQRRIIFDMTRFPKKVYVET
ncbi:hypothetical protein HanIR_Chr07g0326651 [Helianthus annuus]|nr:hypothetical protein HanIR_Chr07g0326651 [Helianthus annuus]